MSKFVDTLETRRLMTVDFGLSGLSSNLPTTVETSGLATTTATVKENLVNKGTEAIPASAGAVGVSFYLHLAAGTDKLLGTVKATKYGGLKVKGTKPLTATFKLPSSVAIGDYSLVAVITGETAIAGSDPTNNYATGKTLSVIGSGTTLFAAYKFSDKLKFKKTTSNSENGAITEEGTFVDANGVTGGYIYATISTGGFGYSVTLSLFRQDKGQSYKTYVAEYRTDPKPPATLNGKTGQFSAKANGGVKATGSVTSAGKNIYIKLS